MGRTCWKGQGAIALAAVMLAATWAAASPDRRPKRDAHAEGRTLFLKEWVAGPTEAGGDGLGPLFNANACVACHNLGGAGGAGTRDHNVNILAAFVGPPSFEDHRKKLFLGELEELHPGFRNHSSVVVHRHAASPEDSKRLVAMFSWAAAQTRDDCIALDISCRSTPALFGAGLIDAIPDVAILGAESRRYAAFPEIRGRTSRLRDGRIGRFGWQGQMASLRDAVSMACATELGLEVPGHHQGSLARPGEFDASSLKLDLDESQVRELTGFVAALPRPTFRPSPFDSGTLLRGRIVFETTGCASCHAPALGGVDGLFSDLLLHDMGDRYRTGGTMCVPPGPVIDSPASKAAGGTHRPTSGEAGPTEWRTPPLWGVASSAPYLHDGRARTLDDAILFHGGEAAKVTARYAALPAVDRRSVLAFLQALTAPPAPRAAQKPRRAGIPDPTQDPAR
ncbi:MAG: di-heme oxidoredictase family protein [Isosphaeraceae bacterium]